MRILCADVRVAGKPHHDWKEGYELMYAFRALGHTCEVAGPNGFRYTELDIPRIAWNYDLIIITDNYPQYSGWKWWDWASIKTPKLFWAIDTHLIDYRPFIRNAQIGYVAFNIPSDMKNYGHPRSFWMPYAVSTIHHNIAGTFPKEYDTVFIGSLTVSARRKEMCDRFNIKHMSVFGEDYFKEMKRSKICFNLSISNDINAKYFEIMGSGSFMLTNYNQELVDFFDGSPDLQACMYKTDDEIGEKIKYYLEHEDEREAIAKRLYDYVWKYHSWEARCQTILSHVQSRPVKIEVNPLSWLRV